MRRMTVIAAGFLFTMIAVAAPALAGHGALARDQDTGKYGFSSNEDTQTKADDVAMKICGNEKCKSVFRTGPKECGALATAELGPTTVDQCELVDDRFTLVALDNYTGDFLDVKLWGKGGGELAAESLYEDDDEADEDEDSDDE